MIALRSNLLQLRLVVSPRNFAGCQMGEARQEVLGRALALHHLLVGPSKIAHCTPAHRPKKWHCHVSLNACVHVIWLWLASPPDIGDPH